MTVAATGTPAALIHEIADRLPSDWASALAAVPRAHFIPNRAWVDQDDRYLSLDRAAEPDRWAGAVYSNRVLATQFDDGAVEWPAVGRRPTCTSSMPSVMLAMLDALDVQGGNRVLEIGTGTGWNAGLLAARLGDAAVTTIEIDPALAELARANLDRAGRHPEVVCADGTAGWPAGAPFDRLIVTAAVQLGRIPYRWVEQVRPGGVIVAPVRTEMASGPLVRFVVGEDGTAVGRAVPTRVGFMELRDQRTPAAPWRDLRWDDQDADLTHSDLEPWSALLADGPQWAIAVALPQCRFDVWKRSPDRDHGVAWLVDPITGSWASVVPGASRATYDVRQVGPRRLWDEAEAAHRWWRAAGQPTVEAWEFVVTRGRQWVRLGGPG